MVLNEENQSPDFEDKYYMPVDSLMKKIFQAKKFVSLEINQQLFKSYLQNTFRVYLAWPSKFSSRPSPLQCTIGLPVLCP